MEHLTICVCVFCLGELLITVELNSSINIATCDCCNITLNGMFDTHVGTVLYAKKVQ